MYKAIIVDDEDTIVTGLSKLLPWARYGCEVTGTAHSAKAALSLVGRVRPDIMFTDICMPGMDGLSLIAALRSEFPQMQVAILSGHPDFEYAQKAIRLGVTNYILKPSKMAELEGALAKMVANLAALKGHDAPVRIPQERVEDAGDNAGNFIIGNAIQYINAHYMEKISLPEVAGKVYVSQWHLSKLIAKNTGQSFSDLLNGVRIREAKKLLASPAYKIWEISELVGFSDVTHFSRIFKKIENCSANEYRNKTLAKPRQG